jgi:uncharacterized protein
MGGARVELGPWLNGCLHPYGLRGTGSAEVPIGLYAVVDGALSNGLPPELTEESPELALPAAPRLRSLPHAEVMGTMFPVAETPVSRFLGLAFLDRWEAGAGLLIPRCQSVHTFGMRFPLDLYFLGRYGEILGVRLGVPPLRVVRHRGAESVLELSPEGPDAA